MPARVQVVIEAKDASSGVLRGITQQLGNFGNVISELTSKNVSWGNLTAVATDLVVDGIKESIKFTQEYSKEVRDQALASKTSAEEASRFLQVLDDYELSAQDAATATRAMTKEGLAPTIDTVISLSEQFQNLTTAQEQNEFMQKNLGRASREWLNLLAQGPDAIREMSDSISEMQILTDEDVQTMEKVRLAQDAWSDAIEGGKIQVGLFFGSLVAANEEGKKHIKILQDLDEAAGKPPQNYRFMTDEQKALIAQWEHAQAVGEYYNRMLTTHNEILEETQVNYKDLIGNIMSYQGELDRYNETNDEILTKEQDLLSQKAELEAQYASLTEWQKKYTSEGKKIPEQLDKIDKELADNGKALKKSEEDFKKWAAQTIFAFAQARAAADGSISAIEGEILVDAGEALGLFDEKTADTMRKVNEAFDSLDTENAQDVIATLQAQLYELVNTPYVVTVSVDVPQWTGPTSTSIESSTSPQPVQSGGRVVAGRPYMVGEVGAEPFFPAVNGRVIGHAEALHALTLGGGGGGTNVFYGNVELVLSAEGAEGLLSLR